MLTWLMVVPFAKGQSEDDFFGILSVVTKDEEAQEGKGNEGLIKPYKANAVFLRYNSAWNNI